MKQYWTLFAFGVLIFFLPFLGFPSAWKTGVLFISGIFIASFAITIIIKERRKHQPQHSQDSSTPPHNSTP